MDGWAPEGIETRPAAAGLAPGAGHQLLQLETQLDRTTNNHSAPAPPPPHIEDVGNRQDDRHPANVPMENVKNPAVGAGQLGAPAQRGQLRVRGCVRGGVGESAPTTDAQVDVWAVASAASGGTRTAAERLHKSSRTNCSTTACTQPWHPTCTRPRMVAAMPRLRCTCAKGGRQERGVWLLLLSMVAG